MKGKIGEHPTINIYHKQNNSYIINLNTLASSLLLDKYNEIIVTGSAMESITFACPTLTSEAKRRKASRATPHAHSYNIGITATNDLGLEGVYYLEENEDESYSIGDKV